jgi:predicted RNA-binding Zn ribbon-like protein
MHALFVSHIDGIAPPRAALEHLNDALTHPRPPARVTYAGGRFQRTQAPLADNADLLRHLADAAAELLETGSAGRLRRCEGAGCVLLFLDVSKTGRRRWCSMAGCGNRAKVRAHYQRTRKES